MQFKKEELIKNPFNYQGGKFKLLTQILPIFPNEIDTFVDLFCGGGDLRDKYGLYDENCIELWDSIRDINAYIHIDLEKITMYKEYEECMDDYDGVNYTIKRFEVYEYDLV